MNAQELINIITPSDILTLMNDLGADLVKETNEYFIFTSICHGSESHKLYYYKNSRSFYCYSNCGSMSVYDTIMKVKDCDFKDAFNYLRTIVNGYNKAIIGFGGRQFKNINLDDIVIEQPLVIDKPFLYKIYSDNINLMKSWSDEGISEDALRKFNIRFDIKGNRMIIPHFREDGQCVGIRVRNFNPKDIERGKYMPLFYDDNCFSHPLSSSLYGLNISKDNIKKYKKCVVFESEKSVLKYESLYPGKNISVSICGSNFSNQQKKMLLDLGTKEIALCLDRQYENEDSEEGRNWKNKIIKNLKNLTDYCQCSFTWDTDENRLLEYKDAPIDRGRKIFEILLRNRIKI